MENKTQTIIFIEKPKTRAERFISALRAFNAVYMTFAILSSLYVAAEKVRKETKKEKGEE